MCEQGGQEGHVYSSVILFRLGEEYVTMCQQGGQEGHVYSGSSVVGILLSIMELCLSAYELVMSQVRLLQLSLNLTSHRAM